MFIHFIYLRQAALTSKHVVVKVCKSNCRIWLEKMCNEANLNIFSNALSVSYTSFFLSITNSHFKVKSKLDLIDGRLLSRYTKAMKILNQFRPA